MVPDLIYDVGMNRGEDTKYYLARGFRVVAVEANPALANLVREQLTHDVSTGRLVIESAAIAEKAGTETFWVNEAITEFSSLIQGVAGRAGMKCTPVTVNAVTLKELFSQYGVPFYLKIDIERADRYCLESLDPSDLPQYISIESHALDYLIILYNLGYRKFKLIDQMRHNSRFRLYSNENIATRLANRLTWYLDRLDSKLRRGQLSHVPGSSGPFGEDTPGEWASIEDVMYNWLHFHKGYKNRGNTHPRSWYDFHAKLG
jgi:FkbM family methyltransferase